MVWPLCHMRHVGKDDFCYFGSSGPLYRMTPMSHETRWQRRLSLFRIIFDQSLPPPTLPGFPLLQRAPIRLGLDMGHNKLMIPWAIKSVIIWYDLCHIWHCFLVYVCYFNKAETKTTLYSWKCGIKYDPNTFLEEYIFNSNFFCLMSFWEKYLYWSQCHIWPRSYQIGLKLENYLHHLNLLRPTRTDIYIPYIMQW
jgi:hypothetical protein